MDNGNKKISGRSGESAMETAAGFLSARMRTVHEVEERLKEKGFSEDDIQETVNDLIGMRYLDDYQYALRYYEYNYEKKRGTARAMAELAQKGVDRETILSAREDFLYENKVDELALAMEVADRLLGDGSGRGIKLTDRKAASLARKLETRGFSKGDILGVLSVLRNRNDYCS